MSFKYPTKTIREMTDSEIRNEITRVSSHMFRAGSVERGQLEIFKSGLQNEQNRRAREN